MIAWLVRKLEFYKYSITYSAEIPFPATRGLDAGPFGAAVEVIGAVVTDGWTSSVFFLQYIGVQRYIPGLKFG